MADITTDVLIIGTGPAGSATAALLASYGLEPMVINRYRWLANTPRAHITNQRAVEVLRDLGVEADTRREATPWEWMGDTLFTTSLAGPEIARLPNWVIALVAAGGLAAALSTAAGLLLVILMAKAERVSGMVACYIGAAYFPTRIRSGCKSGNVRKY